MCNLSFVKQCTPESKKQSLLDHVVLIPRPALGATQHLAALPARARRDASVVGHSGSEVRTLGCRTTWCRVET